MRIASVGIGGSTVRSGTRRPGDAPAAAPQGRALVAVAPVARAEPPRLHRLVRPEPTVIAQLFALRDGHPQAREKRRASPEDARAAYLAAAGRMAATRARTGEITDLAV